MTRPVSPADAARYRAEGWWPDVTLSDLLRRGAARAPDAPAVIAPYRTLTFSALHRESDRLAAGLARLGVGRGDVVSCQLGNVPEMILLHHAVARRRAIFNPIHLPYREAEVETILAVAGSRVMIVGPPARDFSFVEMVQSLRLRLPALRHVVASGETADGVVPFATLLDADETGADRPHPDDPFLLLFTSGTTSSPKATLHTHNMRLGNARVEALDWGLAPHDRLLAISRLSHMWGLMTYWMALWACAAHVLLPAFTPEGFAEAVAQTGVTVAIGAPPHVADLLDAGVKPERLRSLRLFALSGSVGPPALLRLLRRRIGCTPFMLWGMTETGGGLYPRLDDRPEILEETVGRPSPGCRFAVLDEHDAVVPAPGEGELVMQSPFVFEGYAGNPAATADSFTADGWFRTGDLATIDADGNVRILGRKKEQINRGGMKFQPEDVEEIVARHPAVQAAALVGIPDERLGERNCCVIVTHPGCAAPTLEELIALCELAGVAKFKWPERVEVAEALPLTPTGKVQRAVLRASLATRLRRPGA